MMNNTKESIHYADEMWISDLPHNFLQTIHHKIEEPCTLQMCLEEMLQKNNNSQLHEQFNPLSANSDQDQFSPNNIHTLSTDKLWELIKWSPKKNALIFYQILSTHSLRKCMEISLENLYVDTGA